MLSRGWVAGCAPLYHKKRACDVGMFVEDCGVECPLKLFSVSCVEEHNLLDMRQRKGHLNVLKQFGTCDMIGHVTRQKRKL